MFWLLRAARRLRELGILGMNERNASCILDHNPRSRYPIVDDKLRLHELCKQIGVPGPEILGVVRSHSELRRLPALLKDRTDFVLKPNQGSSGRGILVVCGRNSNGFIRHNGEILTLDDLRQHMSDTLSGMYSLGGRPDHVLIQYRVQLHPCFEPIAHRGIPDVRVVVYRNEPAMAMLRLPTKESNGRANLHQGGIGAGIDLATGRTHHAVQRNRFVKVHPDTLQPLVGVTVPYWQDVLTMSRRVAEVVELGYVGVDVVIDRDRGPLLLEANARPGLAIQIANGQGLLPRLKEIDSRLGRTGDPRGLGWLRKQTADAGEKVDTPASAGLAA